MIDSNEDPESTLIFRRSDFTAEEGSDFPEDLRVWQPAVRLIRLVEAEAGILPAETIPTADARKLAAILLWCLATGRYGSWDIEALCDEEPLTHHLAGGLKPTHADIHRFRREHEAPLTEALTRILLAARPNAVVPKSTDAATEAVRRYQQARFADTLPPS